MSLFCEENWNKDCRNVINFKSTYEKLRNNQKIREFVRADSKTQTIKNVKIKKPKNSEKTKILKKRLVTLTQHNVEEDHNIEQLSISKTNSGFEEKLRQTLKGSRFRFLNEKLYVITGSSAKCLFENDPEAFEAYHLGYKNQVQQWPLNPLDRIIKAVKKMPTHYVIVDLGCGEGRLSQSVPHKVYSIDLVSSRDDIIACDMANTPLNSSIADVAIFCLSLMGVNLIDFILEANRILRLGGIIHVAEIASRFDNLGKFVRTINLAGFKLIKKDVSHKLFYFFIFKKIKDVKKNDISIEFSLKPCLYKKR